MSRPKRCRHICGYPEHWSFAPEGSSDPETILLTLDEYEAVRLIDYNRLTQEACANEMGVSRATVAGIYENARFKIADGIVNGKRIRITGGAYQIDSVSASGVIGAKTENSVRIAVTYDHGRVGQHFGRAEQFKIYDVLDRTVTAMQIVDTNGSGHGALAGFLRAAEVEILICGGIGPGARKAIAEMGIRLIPGVAGNVDLIVGAFLADDLPYDPDASCSCQTCRAQ